MNGFEVQLETIDSFVKAYSLIPSIIKIDVEGAELDTLKGGSKTFADHKPHLILELQPATIQRKGDSLESIWDLLVSVPCRIELGGKQMTKEGFCDKDTATLKTLFTTDLEFYHDKEGLTNYAQNMEAFRNTASANTDLRRDLIPGSLKVYEVKDFGAMQIGKHCFCYTENGRPDCGIFKFVHIWKKKDEKFQE